MVLNDRPSELAATRALFQTGLLLVSVIGLCLVTFGLTTQSSSLTFLMMLMFIMFASGVGLAISSTRLVAHLMTDQKAADAVEITVADARRVLNMSGIR